MLNRTLFAAGLAMALTTGAVAPAFAADAAKPLVVGASAKTTDWFAPLNDDPNQTVRLLGLVPVPANEGTVDRAVRLLLGAGLVAVAATDPMGFGTGGRAVAGAGGAIMLWTSATGSCPLYMPIGLDTRRHE